MNKLQVAILYQAKASPKINGILKPMKKGGYSDSGADIAFALQQNNIEVITPTDKPIISNDLNWVFPDTEDAIRIAIEKGANIFWLNTVLFAFHPILKFKSKNIYFVGQEPNFVERFEDKFHTNKILRSNSLPVPEVRLLNSNLKGVNDLKFPIVLKPVRGRGSQGVIIVHNETQCRQEVLKLIASGNYGNQIIAEEFLPGKEITLTIMPPGNYTIKNKKVKMQKHWSLPVVERFNHINGIAPYSGIISVINNSRILKNEENLELNIQITIKNCVNAAKLVGARAPIRIDCRKNKQGNYNLFDLNMKPNMTGSSRDHRKDQDSLTTIAASGIGWTYPELIQNILFQYWKF